MLSAPHLFTTLRAEAVKTEVHFLNHTLTFVLDGKASLELWLNKLLDSLKHLHEWCCAAFKHVEEHERNGKMTPRAVKMNLVGYKTKIMTYGPWDREKNPKYH